MANMLFVSTHGSEDPTRATLPWLFAKGAVESGHAPRVLLSGDAAILAKEGIARGVQGVGIPAMSELVGFAIENRVPVFV